MLSPVDGCDGNVTCGVCLCLVHVGADVSVSCLPTADGDREQGLAAPVVLTR